MPADLNFYELEMAKLPATYADAFGADVSKIKAAIAGASESSIIGVGTGGSFTVASLLCNLHETFTGRVSRPATSLELICNPTLSASSPVFLISAEGKNPDIVEALRRARRHSARAIHIITNRSATELVTTAEELSEISTHIFELVDKDGYLATNSLLLDCVLIARAYSELDNRQQQMPHRFDDLSLVGQSIEGWLEECVPFVEAAVRQRNVIITYSPLLSPIAIDLESKLSEGALLHSQLCDLRSLAHGRHLWFAERPGDSAVVALVEPSMASLWEVTKRLLPSEIPTLTLPLKTAGPIDLLGGLVAEMRFVAVLARKLGRDVGRPNVPSFGRDLYYTNLSGIVPDQKDAEDFAQQSKSASLGARWPSKPHRGAMQRALDKFKSDLCRQSFRSVVFDYDGTLCQSQRNDSPPSGAIVDHLMRLLDAGITIGIASGRGNSIQEQLQESLAKKYWGKVNLALYSGGWITHVGNLDRGAPETSEFLSHVERIVRGLQTLGVPIDQIKTTHPYQISVRFREGLQTEGMWFVIADALRQAGLDVSRMVKSKHSLDILAPGVDKSHLITRLVNEHSIEPYEVLAIGDQGAWPGNDCSLLEHKFSLSVDSPSRRLDRGWKLAPAHKRDVDATIWYLERLQVVSQNRLKFQLEVPLVNQQ